MTAVFIIIVILFFLDLYVFQALKLAIPMHWPEASKMFIHFTYWSVNALLPFIFILAVSAMRKGNIMSMFSIWAGNIWFAFLITKLVVIFFLFGEDIFRFIEGSYTRIFYGKDSLENKGNFLPARREFISQLAVAIAIIPFSSLVYGMIKGRYNYKVHKHVLPFKDLPEAFNGFTITQISDIHAGSFSDRDGVQAGIDIVKNLQSDLVVFTGDLVNTFAKEFDEWLPLFKEISAPYGQFSILGNHDYGEYTDWKSKELKQQNFQAIMDHHEKVGFKLLRDESVSISKDGQSIVLMGVENWGQGFGQRGDLEKALKGVEASDFKILLSHDPSHWNAIVKKHDKQIHLTLSGHTHGMQMGIEIPGLKWSPIQYRYPQWAGIYEEFGRYINVNRGFGVLCFRGRVGIWPEITQIELRRA